MPHLQIADDTGGEATENRANALSVRRQGFEACGGLARIKPKIFRRVVEDRPTLTPCTC
jgi:hypothetical protein